MSNSLQPHGLQHARLTCPSPSPRACSNSCPLSGDTIQPSHHLLSLSPPAFILSQRQGLEGPFLRCSPEVPLEVTEPQHGWCKAGTVCFKQLSVVDGG